MNTRTSTYPRGFTLIEALAVFAVVALICILVLPAMMAPHGHSQRYACVNNLKQVGYGFRVWEGDNQDRYPMAVSVTNGGTMELISGPNAYQHFQVMSNELNTPRILVCPEDKKRVMATTFDTSGALAAGQHAFSGNSNLSYFVGVDATDTNAAMFLAGDRNITNGLVVRNGMLQLTTNRPAGWTHELHNTVGNILMADGSVQSYTTASLRTAIGNTGVETNRLTMP